MLMPRKFLLCGLIYCQYAWAARCTLPSFSWADNSLGQDPCEMTSRLEASCRKVASYPLSQLEAGHDYVTPQANDNPSCECNTVMFALYSACTACQQKTVLSWSFYGKYCKEVYVSNYPGDIPTGLRIPGWAYKNWTEGNVFDPFAAAAAASLPESTPISPPTALPSDGSSTTGLPEDTTSTADPSSNKSSNTGVIAGATVGGIVGLILIGAAFSYLLYRRRRRNGAPVPKDLASDTETWYGDRSSHSPPMESSFRAYDPSDPSTYPPSEPLDNAITYHTNEASARRNYQGIAEV